MSQFFVNSSSGGGGSGVTEIDTQSGNATPSSGVIILNAYDTTENNVFGIETKGNTNGGNPPGTGASNETDVYLTNRFHGSATTTDATQTTISTCPMTLRPAVYQFILNLCVYDATNDIGASSVSTVTFRAVNPIGSPVSLAPNDFIIQGDAAFGGSVDLQGTSTAFNVRVTGVAATTMRWTCHGTYTVVS
jgi:hypothetical protein